MGTWFASVLRRVCSLILLLLSLSVDPLRCGQELLPRVLVSVEGHGAQLAVGVGQEAVRAVEFLEGKTARFDFLLCFDWL